MQAPSALTRFAVRSAASALSGRGRGSALLVLIFHRVLAEPDPVLPDEPDVGRFTAIVDLLASCFTPLSLREAVTRLRESTLPPRAVCVTFDDGYANNCEIARPILVARGVPATVFVAPGFLDGGRMFNDTVIETVRRAPEDFDLRALDLGRHALTDAAARRRTIEVLLEQLKYLEIDERLRRIAQVADAAGVRLPDDLMMTRAQVRTLHQSGIEIGAHTVDHPILASVADEVAESQIRASREQLEAMIGAPVKSFAYPNGKPHRDYLARHVGMARAAGFDLALATAWGAATAESDPFQIPRVAAWDSDALRYGLRLARAYRDRQPVLA